MEEYNEVRRLRFVEQYSIRRIMRETGIHRKTIRKIIREGAPPGYRRKSAPSRPKLEAMIPFIDAMLKLDRKAPAKQRHTAQRIFDRLKDEHGYQGGYTQVRVYVKQARALQQEAFVPLEFGPAEAQTDWGEAQVILDGEQTKAYLFVMTLPYSDARFVAAFPRANMEFFLEGHSRAFAFFGGVPARIIYDNLKSAVKRVFPGRGRELNETFDKFRERHLFEAAFCNVARGNEKGHVENGVGWARRNFLVPVPEFPDWEHLNEYLTAQCRQSQAHVARGHEHTVAERLEQERAHLRPVPIHPAPCAPVKPQGVDSLCLVRFDTNAYSVPCWFAHLPVVVRADVSRVCIYIGDQRIASHQRCFQRERAVYEPWHYLALIENKPRALDYGAPMKQLEDQLDECFDVLRRRMEAGQQYSEGTRSYIRVLRLLEHHSLADLTRAVRRAIELGLEHEEAVKHLLLCPPERTPSPLDLTGRAHLAAYRIPNPDIARYGALGREGGEP